MDDVTITGKPAMGRRRAVLLSAVLLLLSAPLLGLEGELLKYARLLGADCAMVPSMQLIGTCPPDSAAEEIYRLLWEKDDFDAQRAPLISGDDLRAYGKTYFQEQVIVAEKGRVQDRLRLFGQYDDVVASLGGEKANVKAFYLLRMLALVADDGERARTIFERLKAVLTEPTLPHRLAYLGALETYLNAGAFDRVTKASLRSVLNRTLAEAAVRLVELGAFDAARSAVQEAAEESERSWQPTAEFLLEFIAAREALWKDVTRLRQSREKTKEGAREWALLLLGTFRRYEAAFEAMRASGDSTLGGLVTLLETRGGLAAAAEIVKDLAAAMGEPEAVGLRLLALELYDRASPRKELPQVKELLPLVNGRIDPLLAARLDPAFAHRGVTIRVVSDPPRSFVYVDSMLQAVPGSLVRTPCSIVGVEPGKRHIVVASLGRRDIAFGSVSVRHGLIVCGAHRDGKSALLAKAGKNRFLRKRISVNGPREGHDTLFDGEVRPLHRQKGFAVNKWPCVFTIRLPQTLKLSAIRIKLWDGKEPAAREYKYRLEISDGRTVTCVADRSKKGGTSWQNILFPTQRVRTILLHCLHNSANSSFQVLEIEGYDLATPEDMRNPIVETGA